jgi:hypothetical protein
VGLTQGAFWPSPGSFSSGLPFDGLIFYGAVGFAMGELDNSIKIKGLLAALSLWRAI